MNVGLNNFKCFSTMKNTYQLHLQNINSVSYSVISVHVLKNPERKLSVKLNLCKTYFIKSVYIILLVDGGHLKTTRTFVNKAKSNLVPKLYYKLVLM